MSQQCDWQNNHAVLGGTTIYYNKKNVRTSKTKATSKPIRFYYIMSASKAPPTVPSNQGFYQSKWDDPDRSNRSLKRSTPPQQAHKKLSSPPTKKAKASSPRSLLPPESFKVAN
jgi:hypothetical protein